ncbi:hypothetical protein FRC07_014371, partial [Ceratobasidium sp. 392]
MTFLELKQQLSDTKRKLEAEEDEKRQLRSRIFNLQQEVVLLKNTERRKQEEIHQLKGRLGETKNPPRPMPSNWDWDRSYSGKRDTKGKGRETQGPQTSLTTNGRESPVSITFDDVDWPRFPPKTSNRPTSSRAHTISTATVGPSSSRARDINIEDGDVTRSLEVAMALQREYDQEQMAMLEDQHLAQTIERRKFDCGICMDTFTDEAIALVDGCDHSCCRECMRSHVQSKIDERRYPISCPFCVVGSENKSGGRVNVGVISPTLVETIGVTPEQFNIYTELQMAEHSIMIDCRG